MPAPGQLSTIVGARLLVALVGGSGGLGWWADESLSEAGRFVLARLFPRTHARTARRLSVLTAAGRYQAAAPTAPGVRHLYFLGNVVEAAIDGVDIGTVALPESIADTSELRSALEALGNGRVPAYRVLESDASGAVRIEIPGPGAGELSRWPEQAALALADAACAGGPGAPVFPYLVSAQ